MQQSRKTKKRVKQVQIHVTVIPLDGFNTVRGANKLR